jgi:GTP-binding protein
VKVKSVSYLGSFGDTRSLPPPRGPEIAFVGRSNVGKSSLINTLVGRKNLARTSNAPGKTRTVNYYLVNDAFCLVDMPGYGFAQVSKEERGGWKRLIVGYLAQREALCGVVQLLDVRHTPSDADRDLAALIEDTGKPLCLAFNKTDKLSRPIVGKSIAEHLRALDVAKDDAVVAFSSKSGEGKRELWTWILQTMGLLENETD